jgi:serralysin
MPIGSDPEITFISGVTSSATVAGTSFWTWNFDNPASYQSVVSFAAKWGSATPGTSGGNVTYWFDGPSSWNAAEQTALVSGLALWSAVANIAFSPAAAANSANFIFYRNHNGSAFESSSYLSTTNVDSGSTGSYFSTGSRISIDTTVPGFGPIGAAFGVYGGYPYQTLVHEIGHLIGLGHGGPYNGNVNTATQQFSAYDTRLWSLMSYIDPWITSAKFFGSYPVTGTNWGISPDGYHNEPTTPMILDILAAQRLYGAATSGPLAGGGQVFGFNSNINGPIAPYFNFTVNTHPVITIWDGGLNNTFDLSGWSTPSIINLNPGTFSSANGAVNNIGIAADTIIETAVGGGGNDTIIGNSSNNILIGGGGNDTLAGGAGADQLIGGPGLDTADYSSSPAPVSVNLQTGAAVGGDAQGDSFSGIENIVGSAFADTLMGDAGANVFDGGPGGDAVTGGAGADWLLLRAASYGVDTFTDFSADNGDRIVLDHVGFGLAGVGSLAAAGVSLVYGLTPFTAAPTILDSQGNLYWDPDGTGPSPASALVSVPHTEGLVSVTNFETGGWNVIATGAFNNDNTSDILWQNASSGDTSEWLMANGTLAGSPATPGAPGWNVIAAGNFNGDGISDLLWQHTASDMTAEWLMAPNGGVGALLGTPPVQGWNLLASADFNGDHITDLFWQHAASGATAEWLMAPTGGVANLLSTPPVQGWNLLASADFNGDGTTDLMWQHVASGATAEWLMAPTGGVGALLSTPPAQGWNMVATGDFNGDHIADLFWQHAASGATAEWLMAPTGGVGALLSTPAAPGWNVVATGDFNGDHIADLFWQHASSGATAEWLMAPTGGAGALLSTPPAQGWNLIAAADFNGDGTTDPLWQHASAGVTSLWLTAPTGGVGSFQDTPTAAGLSLITAGDFSGDGATDLMWRNPSTGATTTWMFSHLTQQDFLVV